MTAELCSDAELCLDVRAELASHFEEAMESFIASGCTVEEAREKALASFGTDRELSLELGMANHQRLGARNVARLVLSRVLVPVSLVVAAVVISHSYQRLNHLTALFTHLQRDTPPNPLLANVEVPSIPSPAYVPPVERLPAEKAFYFHGDLNRPSYATQQRAIWERAPDNRVYAGNYISALTSGRDRSTELLLDELSSASLIDKGNARYDLLLAGIHARQALTGNDPEGKRDAIDALHRALEKRYYRRYQLAMLLKRLSLLAPVRKLEDQVERWSVSQLQSDHDMRHLNDVLLLIRDAASEASAKGATEEAYEMLTLWQPVLQLVSQDAVTDRDVSGLQKLAATVEKHIAPEYERLGLAQEAQVCRSDAREIQRVIFDSRQTARERVGEFMNAELVQSGSLFSQLTAFQVVKSPYPGVLEDGFWAEHIILEQMALAGLIGILVVLMVVSLLVWLRWGGKARSRTTPGVLLLGWREGLRLMAGTVILPMAVYIVYSRWAASVWHYSASYDPGRFLFEALMLLVTIISLYGWNSSRMIRKRCRELRLPVPGQAGPWAYMLLWGCSMGLWGMFLVLRSGGTVPAEMLPAGSIVISVMALVLLSGGFLVQIAGRACNAVYRVTCARTLTALYAMALLFIGMIVLPLMERQELRHLENQRLYAEFQDHGFMNMEYKQVSGIRKDIQRVFDDEGEEG